MEEYRSEWKRLSETPHGLRDDNYCQKVLDTIINAANAIANSTKVYANTSTRVEAEMDFFDYHNDENLRDEARNLLERILKHRHRHYDSAMPEPICLLDLSGRHLIAAERLYQETLINLNSAFSVDRLDFENAPKVSTNILVIHDYGEKFGPMEIYKLGYDTEEYCVKAVHRAEFKGKQNNFNVSRLGRSYVVDVGKYRGEGGIVEFFKNTFPDLKSAEEGTRRAAQELLGDMFVQFGHSHKIRNTARLTPEQMEELLRICFLIMVKEQCQWQAAHFIGNPKGRFGMPVSFARLVLLFKAGEITIDEMLIGLQVYSVESMGFHLATVTKSCYDIDTIYQRKMLKNVEILTKERALNDLFEVYGGRPAVAE